MTRVQKITLKLLWWREMWPYLWMHKPLCDKYMRDVLRIGRLRLCRSCGLMYLGVIVGMVFWLYWGSLVPDWVGYVLTGVVVSLSWPVIYRHVGRCGRDILRFGLGSVIALFLSHIVMGQWIIGGIGVFLLAVARRIYMVGRKLRIERSCGGCEHLGGEGHCPGFAERAVSIGRYERYATEYLYASGYVPECVQAKK